MRKTILLAVIACILGIVLLAALAFYIPNGLGRTENDGQSEVFTGFHFSTEEKKKDPASAPDEEEQSGVQDSRSMAADGQLPNDTLPGSRQPETETAGKKETTAETETELSSELSRHPVELPAQVKPHQLIWVGDSRTLGLRDALHKVERTDDDLFIGQVGEGVRWFREEGMSQLSDAIAEHPDLPVVMNFGVNDPQLVSEYVVAYWDVIRAHPNTHFYILSVNPLDEEFLIEDGQVDEHVFDDINSLNVAKMNVKLKDEFASRYIDSASFLKEDGFETVDGLHFSTQTYLKIHDFVVNRLF